MMQKKFLAFIAVALFTLSFVAEAPAQKRGLGQLPEKVEKKIFFNGKALCTKKESNNLLNVNNQCEIGVDCDTGKPLPYTSLAKLLGVAKVIITVPGQECATFDIDIGNPINPCRCSRGRCYCW